MRAHEPLREYCRDVIRSVALQPVAYCDICGSSAAQGRRCVGCKTVLCHSCSHSSLTEYDKHGHSIVVWPDSRKECFACAKPKLADQLNAANSRDWIECSIKLEQPAWSCVDWRELANFLRERYLPEEVEFDLDPGIFRNRRRVVFRGWLVDLWGSSIPQAVLRESDLMWGSGPSQSLSKAKWMASFGSTSTGPFGGERPRLPTDASWTFKILNRHR